MRTWRSPFSASRFVVATHRWSAVATASNRTGFVMKSSIPAAMHRSRSPSMAAAVMAMIGMWLSDPSNRRMAAVASYPSISGIWQSMSTAS